MGVEDVISTSGKKCPSIPVRYQLKPSNYMTALDSMKRCPERLNDIFKKTSLLNHKLIIFLE